MSGTIRDVAEAAGVSITTVSHVLSGRGRVAQKTRLRVAQVAKELAYRPNVHAQQLVTRRSRTFAIQVASFTEPSDTRALIPHSEYFLDLLNGAAEAAADLGYALILTPPNVAASSLEEFAVDGVIMVDPRGDEPLFLDHWHDRRPMVTTGRPTTDQQLRAIVDNDHRAATLTMLDHLEQQGYVRPALVITNTSRSYVADMLSAYQAWTAARGLDELVMRVGETPSEGAAAGALRSLFDRSPTPDAIYTSSEELALGVLHEAQRRGLKVPQELGVCSAVDSSALRLTTPQVTGMHLNPREIGRRAAQMLCELASAPDSGPHHIDVPVHLFERESTLRRTAKPGRSMSQQVQPQH